MSQDTARPLRCMFELIGKEVHQEIMATDIYVGVLGDEKKISMIEKDIDECFDLFRNFETRFSRFQQNNELSVLNSRQESTFSISPDLMEMLVLAKTYHERTGGIFDITMLPLLEQEGYTKSALQGFTHEPQTQLKPSIVGIEKVLLDPERLSVTKPLELRIDLGGLGKGFIVDQVAAILKKKGYTDFLVDAGGDLFAAGQDLKHGYPWWAIDVEIPGKSQQDSPSLMLSYVGVATSGTNRRHWTKDGQTKHHLIDVRSGKSAETTIQTVTVVAPTVVEADIWAKSLLILGVTLGYEKARELSIPALFVDHNNKITLTPALEPYLWKPSAEKKNPIG